VTVGIDEPDHRGRTGLDRAGRDLTHNPDIVVRDVELLDGEDIEVVELPFAEALAMTADGRIADAKTIMLLQWAVLSGPFRELHDSEPVGS
jgi:hypothetical protein